MTRAETGRRTAVTPFVGDARAFSGLFEEMLKRSGLTVGEMAKRLGVQPSTLKQYRYGRRGPPKVETLCRWLSACGARLTVEWLE